MVHESERTAFTSIIVTRNEHSASICYDYRFLLGHGRKTRKSSLHQIQTKQRKKKQDKNEAKQWAEMEKAILLIEDGS